MRRCSITDCAAEALRQQGIAVPQFVLEELQAAGFDLTREIIYAYEPRDGITYFIQYESGDYSPPADACQHCDTDYSTAEAWAEGCEQLARLAAAQEQRRREVA